MSNQSGNNSHNSNVGSLRSNRHSTTNDVINNLNTGLQSTPETKVPSHGLEEGQHSHYSGQSGRQKKGDQNYRHNSNNSSKNGGKRDKKQSIAYADPNLQQN